MTPLWWRAAFATMPIVAAICWIPRFIWFAWHEKRVGYFAGIMATVTLMAAVAVASAVATLTVR